VQEVFAVLRNFAYHARNVDFDGQVPEEIALFRLAMLANKIQAKNKWSWVNVVGSVQSMVRDVRMMWMWSQGQRTGPLKIQKKRVELSGQLVIMNCLAMGLAYFSTQSDQHDFQGTLIALERALSPVRMDLFLRHKEEAEMILKHVMAMQSFLPISLFGGRKIEQSRTILEEFRLLFPVTKEVAKAEKDHVDQVCFDDIACQL
jgi:hypothetical protein